MPYIKSQGTKLYYEEAGSGCAIVFLHEFAADFRTWEAQVRRFSRDYRCITYNARGYPPSDVPTDPGAYASKQQREDLSALLDTLQIDAAHLVGLSMGAYTALQFALEYPERARSVMFASGGSGAHPAIRERFRQEALAGAQRMRRDGMEAGANGLAFGPTRVQLLNKDPRGWAQFHRYLSEHSALGSALTLEGYQADRPSLYDLEPVLRGLDVPILLAVGDEDDPVIETNLFLKRTLPRAGLWIHPRSGHGINLEDPDAFNAQLASFLASIERDRWLPRDVRANAGNSVFMGDQATGEDY